MPPTPNEQQERIFLKIGKMMVNLQAFEHKLKVLLSSRRIQGDLATLTGNLEKRRASYAQKMLGLLADELTTKAIRVEGTKDDQPDEELPINQMRIELFLHLSSTELEEFRDRLKDLIQDRNKLIHHFAITFDLMAPEQLDAAEQFVDDLRAKFLPLNEQVYAWLSLLPKVSDVLRRADMGLSQRLSEN
jgi:hypothetical protein